MLAWVLVSFDSLDGMRGSSEFNFWRMMAACYVLGFGLILLFHVFRRIPSWLSVLAWSGFGAGLMFWATAATGSWWLWFITGLGSWFMAYIVAFRPEWDESYGG